MYRDIAFGFKEMWVSQPLRAFDFRLVELVRDKHRGALRGTPGSACPQPEPNAAELPSCALSKRGLHKNGGGGGGGEARKARAARAPNAKSCATSCGTSSAAPSATAPRPWRARPSCVA